MTVLINYNLGIPDGPNNPSNDQPNMKENNDNINQILSVDHIPFNVTNSGYHTVIHQLSNGGFPAADPPAIPLPPVGQTYVKEVTANSTTDTQLFFRTALGGISQLTGNNATQNGYQWIGGTLIQWGLLDQTISNPVNGGLINFPIPFPTETFIINATFFPTAPLIALQNPGATLTVNAVDVNKFAWAIYITNPNFPSVLRGFYWFAIGA